MGPGPCRWRCRGLRRPSRMWRRRRFRCWELKMMGLAELNAPVQAPALRTEVKPANTATPTPVKPAPPKPGAAKPAATQTAAATPPADAAPPDEASQKAADGFLINGSSNNGASSPFALNPAFGNNRRGGRSLYNGSIGMNLGNSVLDARPYSLTGQDTEKPQTSRLVGLFSFGGPLKIPRLLRRNGPNFTVNYQWTHSRNGTTQTGLMPTGAQRIGDLSALATPMIDPLSGKPFIGNQIPLDAHQSAGDRAAGVVSAAKFRGHRVQLPDSGDRCDACGRALRAHEQGRGAQESTELAVPDAELARGQSESAGIPGHQPGPGFQRQRGVAADVHAAVLRQLQLHAEPAVAFAESVLREPHQCVGTGGGHGK